MPKTWLQQKDQQVQKKIKVWKFTPTHILTHCLWVCNFLKIDLRRTVPPCCKRRPEFYSFFWQNSQCWKNFSSFWLIKQWILANEQTQVWQISSERRMPSNHSVDQKGSWLLFLGSQVMRGHLLNEYSINVKIYQYLQKLGRIWMKFTWIFVQKSVNVVTSISEDVFDQVCWAQCGKFFIFQSLIFYVKSTLEILEVKMCHFYRI